jgi:hypothetical protein
MRNKSTEVQMKKTLILPLGLAEVAFAWKQNTNISETRLCELHDS